MSFNDPTPLAHLSATVDAERSTVRAVSHVTGDAVLGQLGAGVPALDGAAGAFIASTGYTGWLPLDQIRFS